MADLVFVVDDPVEWHKKNLEMNSSHYSGLKYLGAKGIARIQENWACGVYYNSFVTVDDQVRSAFKASIILVLILSHTLSIFL
jgi:translocator assembly and maintenance protein 41